MLKSATPEQPEQLPAEELDGICAQIVAEQEEEAKKKRAEANA